MKYNRKRDRILAAGSEFFSRFGYDKTTLDDIGRRIGLNKASLYYYFKSKEDLYIAVVRAEIQTFLADLQTKAAAYPDLRRQIRFYLTERIRRSGELMDPGFASIANFGSLFDEIYQETKAGELAFLTALLRRIAQDNGLAVNEPSTVLAEHLFMLSEALKHSALHAAGRLAGGETDFAPAVAEMEYWLKMVLR